VKSRTKYLTAIQSILDIEEIAAVREPRAEYLRKMVHGRKNSHLRKIPAVGWVASKLSHSLF
jgi:hypothetical protein